MSQIEKFVLEFDNTEGIKFKLVPILPEGMTAAAFVRQNRVPTTRGVVVLTAYIQGMCSWQPIRTYDAKRDREALSHYETRDLAKAEAMARNSWVRVSGDVYEAFASLKSTDHMSRNTASLSEIDWPVNNFGMVPWDFQASGIKYILDRWQNNLGVLQGDDMGLGKTAQTLYSILMSPGIRKVLILCPLSVAPHWFDEARRVFATGDERFCKKSMFTPSGHEVSSRKVQLMQKATETIFGNLVIGGHNYLSQDRYAKGILSQEWDAIIIDEIHEFRNPDTKMVRNLHKLVAKYRMGLTGTPVPKDITDLWPQLHFLNPKMFPDLLQFKERYKGAKGEKSLNKLMRSNFFIRRLKAQVFQDLPKGYSHLVTQELPEEFAWMADDFETKDVDNMDYYQMQAEQLREDLEAAKDPDVMESIQLRLEAVIDKVFSMVDQKIALPLISRMRADVAELKAIWAIAFSMEMEEQYPDDKQIIVCHHERVAKKIANTFSCPMITGSVKDRQAQIKAMKFAKRIVVTIGAANTGVNLQMCNRTIFAEYPWNASEMMQMKDRTRRPGQIKHCHWYFLVYERSIEYKLANVFTRKKLLHDNIVA